MCQSGSLMVCFYFFILMVCFFFFVLMVCFFFFLMVCFFVKVVGVQRP